jgi:hypothetical protein
VAFLSAQALDTPSWLFESPVLERVGIQGSSERIRGLMVSVLNRMLDPSRMGRMAELQHVASGGYPLAEYLADVRGAVWTELGSGQNPDLYRRALQRAWVERMAFLMKEDITPPTGAFAANLPPVPSVVLSDIRPLVRQELTRMRTRLVAARGGDAVTRAHYADAAARIRDILEPR